MTRDLGDRPIPSGSGHGKSSTPWALLLGLAAALAACASPKATDPAPTPRGSRQAPRASQQLEKRIARLELNLLERDAQVEDLQSRLDETRREVVRAMAKLQTFANRAEAASAIAEGEVALQTLGPEAGSPSVPEVTQGTRLLQESAAEFDRENYGGALYLANQAKALAAAGRRRQAAGALGAQRPGETAFALPIRLKAVSRGNVREGPGTGTRMVFSLEAGAAVTGYSYSDEWIRISDEEGRAGWIFRGLLARR